MYEYATPVRERGAARDGARVDQNIWCSGSEVCRVLFYTLNVYFTSSSVAAHCSLSPVLNMLRLHTCVEQYLCISRYLISTCLEPVLTHLAEVRALHATLRTRPHRVRPQHSSPNACLSLHAALDSPCARLPTLCTARIDSTRSLLA